MSRSDFVAAIGEYGGDTEAAKIIHSKLQDWVYYEEFTPYPSDSLSSLFGIAEEELDEDLILDLLMSLGVSTPSRQEMRAFGAIDTSAHVARFVAMVRVAEGDAKGSS